MLGTLLASGEMYRRSGFPLDVRRLVLGAEGPSGAPVNCLGGRDASLASGEVYRRSGIHLDVRRTVLEVEDSS